MLPDGWHVTQTDVAFIRAEGPEGELAMFGVSVPAHNATGAGAPPPERLNQSYSADPGDKLNQSIQWVRAANHLSPVTVIKIYSNTPFAAPKEFAQLLQHDRDPGRCRHCPGREADLCSLPVDANGDYINFLKIVAISPALAKSERSTVEAMLASYVLNMKALQQQQQQAEQAASQPTKMACRARARHERPRPERSRHAGFLECKTPSRRRAGNRCSNRSIPKSRLAASRHRWWRRCAPRRMRCRRRDGSGNAQMQATDQAVDNFDRTTLRGEIPVAIANQGTFWVDPN